MSGAAASAGASKFTAFMNHPAGKFTHNIVVSLPSSSFH
jgi:hypothetical protein